VSQRRTTQAASEARTAALTSARDHALLVLASLNDDDRDPATRAEAQRRRGILLFSPVQLAALGWTPADHADVAADHADGIATTRLLLKRWDHGLVEKLLEQVVVKGAAYRLLPNGRVELEPRLSQGPAAALAALSLAQARDLLRSVDGGSDPFKRRIKQCANPTCGKWFFDADRGTRKWCCVACGNAHRQLKLDRENYLRRLKEYKQRRSPCSRKDCEG